MPYTDNFASLYWGTMGVFCVVLGLVFAGAAYHWWVDRAALWKVWSIVSVIFFIVGILLVWRS